MDRMVNTIVAVSNKWTDYPSLVSWQRLGKSRDGPQGDAWLNPSDASEAELKKRTLTNLYNARPTWLDNAHKKLDTAVSAANGWPADLSDEAILERLLALNGERAKLS